jgi:hypothetical protein
MEQPIKSNGYEKYIIQIGWWNPDPSILIAVLAQDILAKTRVDGTYLMKLLYPKDIAEGLPYLCPVIEEISGGIGDMEDGDDLTGGLTNNFELLFPN